MSSSPRPRLHVWTSASAVVARRPGEFSSALVLPVDQRLWCRGTHTLSGPCCSVASIHVNLIPFTYAW